MSQHETSQDGHEQDGHENDADTPMSAELREHIGRRLRAEFRLEVDKPTFLGDTAIPPQFATLVRKIEEREELPGREGLHAIRQEFGLPDDER